MNLAALIGEVVGPVEPAGDDGVAFPIGVIGPPGEDRERIIVHVPGAQAAACLRFLEPGHRVAVEGRVRAGARPAEVVAERVQFLTTRAQADAMREVQRSVV